MYKTLIKLKEDHLQTMSSNDFIMQACIISLAIVIDADDNRGFLNSAFQFNLCFTFPFIFTAFQILCLIHYFTLQKLPT